MMTLSQNSEFPSPLAEDSEGSAQGKWQPHVAISIITAPFLLGLLGARAIAASLTQLGLASEEVFRGERLPVLSKVPGKSASSSGADFEEDAA